MCRTLARRATPAVLALSAMLWLAAGPAVAAPAVLGPSAPGGSLLESLWSWVTGFWTAASSEPAREKTALGEHSTDSQPSDDPVTDKGVLIDPNGQH